MKQALLEFIVARCSKIKADIVSKDEREEEGLRTILNFGHTVGHAIETAAKFVSYNHGEDCRRQEEGGQEVVVYRQNLRY